MAYSKVHTGKGSTNSKARWEKREFVKKAAKKRRRAQGKAAARKAQKEW